MIYCKSLLVILLLSLSTLVIAEPTVSLTLDKNRVNVGATVTGHLSLLDFPTTQGGGIKLRFNADVLEVTDIVFDSAWSFAAQTGNIDNDKGVIKDIIFAAFPGWGGDVAVATITFKAVRKGKSRIRLKKSALNPFASEGSAIDVSFKKTKIIVGGKKKKNTRNHSLFSEK
ncbi:MAG: cohesin domain-containing protein [Pseudomonadales bacterium]